MRTVRPAGVADLCCKFTCTFSRHMCSTVKVEVSSLVPVRKFFCILCTDKSTLTCLVSLVQKCISNHFTKNSHLVSDCVMEENLARKILAPSVSCVSISLSSVQRFYVLKRKFRLGIILGTSTKRLNFCFPEVVFTTCSCSPLMR